MDCALTATVRIGGIGSVAVARSVVFGVVSNAFAFIVVARPMVLGLEALTMARIARNCPRNLRVIHKLPPIWLPDTHLLVARVLGRCGALGK